MKQSTGMLTSIVLLAAGLSGCENTGQAVQKDISNDTQAVTTKVTNARKEVHEIRKNAGAALTLTPHIKADIIEDPVLRTSSNSINISSTETTVVIAGHVLTTDMKRRATEDVQRVLDKRNAHQKIDNQLKVTGAK